MRLIHYNQTCGAVPARVGFRRVVADEGAAQPKLRSNDALFEQNRQQPQRQSSAVCCHEEYGHRRQCKCTHDEVQVPALTTTRGVLGRV